MNPLTQASLILSIKVLKCSPIQVTPAAVPALQIKNTQKATQREIVAGISEKASWHARYKHSGARPAPLDLLQAASARRAVKCCLARRAVKCAA